MATDTLKAGIPQIALDAGYSIVFEAIDPATGLPVAGVVISNVTIYGDDLAAGTNAADNPPRLASGLLPG